MQLERWHSHSAQGGSSSGSDNSKPQLELTLDSPDQQAAAEAVIASLYLIKDAMTQLDTVQLVQTVVLADRLQITVAMEQAVQLLCTAAKEIEGLPAATLDALAGLCTWPRCLYPLLPVAVEENFGWKVTFKSTYDQVVRDSKDPAGQRLQRVLVAALGHLNSVWADDQQKQALLQLPVGGLYLLLLSDQLVVDSEDTVLYTALEYLESIEDRRAKESTSDVLTELVRCQHLSVACLQSVALGGMQYPSIEFPQYALQRLLSLRIAHGQLLSPRLLATWKADIRSAPSSWSLPARQLLQQVPEVSVVWCVPVPDIKEACDKAAHSRGEEQLRGPSTPPRAGLAWKPFLACTWVSGQIPGCQVGCFMYAPRGVAGVCQRVTYSITVCAGDTQLPMALNKRTTVLMGKESSGTDDLFQLGTMAGGWDEAAWAAEGLPPDGDLQLKLVVHHVEHDGLPSN